MCEDTTSWASGKRYSRWRGFVGFVQRCFQGVEGGIEGGVGLAACGRVSVVWKSRTGKRDHHRQAYDFTCNGFRSDARRRCGVSR